MKTTQQSPRPPVASECTNRPPSERAPSKAEPLLDLLDLLCPDDSFIGGLEDEAEALLKQVLDCADSHRFASVGTELRVSLAHIRALVGGRAKVGLVVAMSDASRFDRIHLPSEVEATCERHGLRIKASTDDDVKIILMNIGVPNAPARPAL